ncbi:MULTISPECIES: trehalose operon repressor [unclassified Clostridioides]|uniref:trehalose operon repressor n=1 Tax=unclassified Clostridioides TaxID=2635829 RepID=UPI001D0FDBD6|nr:trehalose operon repressor [Clostridioides sp. ZZV14-6150]MCC0660856.1 trehalose operon repressor [Clostridioides sp. ZZV14-6154]MCC0667983.1 trehalose operon repressor [Clostridioides sp. ZZV14-6153]MCC0717490.1 trehalose operon repressor [Clostridioides sp. ZZV14-6105]MCC0721382.1 trehalose operon repressor [Clostridioides sp. ZZV14-6104]MCC0725574.1 trehalose operon repressor [Clostridioides sp. ZZV14-6045]MCC0729672.1 trehalose operon repressor [Clostridioides sp. ZZV14-6048]MCC073432
MNKYFSIYTDLKEQIIDGDYPVRSYLPSEQTLAENYDTSRETVRKALRLLSDEGYIQKKPRKGNMIIDAKKFVLSASNLSSYKEFAESQSELEIESSTIVLDFNTIPCPQFLKDRFETKKLPEIHYILRQRKINNETIILDKDYLVRNIVPNLTKDIAEDSLYDYIEKKLRLNLSYARKEITVEPVTKEDKQYMDLNGDTHVVVIRSEVYLEDTRFIQHTESRHRIDKFRIVEFARRRST